jgi:hypothetical protein
MQDIVDRARIPLNDADPIDANRRYPDAELLKHAKGALQLLRTKRPDLFFGAIAAFTAETLTLGSTFPLQEGLAPAVQDYVSARSQMKDDESAVAGLAAAFFGVAQSET